MFDRVFELFGETIRSVFGVVAIMLLNVMDVLVWVEVFYCTDRVWSSIECVRCVCDPGVHLDVPSRGFV